MSNHTEKSSRKRVEYIPPSNETIDELAKKVCEEMAKREQDNSYNSFDVRSGFAQFLKVVAKIQAKRLTEEAN